MMHEIELHQYRIPKNNDLTDTRKIPTKQSNFQLRLRKYSIWKNIEIVVSNF